MARGVLRNSVFFGGAVAFWIVYAFGSSGAIFAGETRAGATPIRAVKVQKGDWFLFSINGELTKETALEAGKIEGDYEVKYSVEKFDDRGNTVSREEYVHLFSAERESAAELDGNRSVRRERKRVQIDGKNVNVTVAVFSGEAPYEIWYSDEISITGMVAMLSKIPESETFWSIKPLAFGAAGSTVDARRYLGSK